jgi:putative nucleotidyltransferase with HDIG domain
MMLGLLPYMEILFGITSPVRLLELANPNEPLLKRLLIEAPGTYHHSIMVGNLAEAAAQVVNADPLLVRVGAYYHDIGKIKRPYFFVENQMGRENPHKKIAPSLSTLIITSHVRDGLEQAREHKLPAGVQAIIEQHHGSSLVAYFYQQALEGDRAELVTEADFRYDCPKPQTKEAALVMLADSVEAAVRSLQKPTPSRVEAMARKIIKERLHDGQLDECDLTFKDLSTITATFIQVLGGIFHSRIEYPENMITEIERRRARGAVVNQ